MMYSVVEINRYDQVIGIIDLDQIEVSSGMSFYWNSKLTKEKKLRTHTLSSAEAERAYHIAKKMFPNKTFEIR